MIEKFDLVTFRFGGLHGTRYTLYHLGELKLLGRVAELPREDPPVTYFCGIDLYCPDPAAVEVAGDGTVTATSGAWKFEIERKFCALDARDHPREWPPAPRPTPLWLGGPCQVYAAPSPTLAMFGPGVRAIVTSVGCSLDAPGHKGSTGDAPHPLQGIAHCNVRILDYPPAAERIGEAGLMVDGDRPDARPEDYAAEG